MTEDILIYEDNRHFFAKGKISGEIIIASADASNTLGRAVDKLSDTGGKISVMSGKYHLGETLVLKSGIALEGSGMSTCFIAGEGFSDPCLISAKGVRDVIVSSLVLENRGSAETGLHLSDTADSRIRDITVKRFRKYGIHLSDGSFLVDISGCRSAGNGDSNFYFSNLTRGRGGEFLPNTLSNCQAYLGGNGFETHHSIVLNLSTCVCVQPGGKGFYIHDESNSVLISGCRTYQIGGEAVYIKDSDEINISSSIFCWQRGDGIVLDNAMWGTIAANNIIDSGVRSRDGRPKNGITLKNNCRGIQITGNAIFNWGDQTRMEFGIHDDSPDSKNLLCNNAINHYTSGAIQVASAHTVVCNNNISEGDAFRSMDKPPYPDFTTTGLENFFNEL